MSDGADGLVVAGGRGHRLGQGPKALLRLGGETLVERAVGALRPLCERVIVGAPEGHVDEVAGLVGAPDVAVVAGGATRMGTVRALVAEARAEWLVITDVVHPFVDEQLAGAVLDAARAHGAAHAGLANTDHVIEPGAGRSFDAGTLWTLQKPIACRTAALREALDGRPDAMGVAQALEGSGQPATVVPGKPTNVKITHPADLRLAEAIELATGRGPRPRRSP